MGKTFAVIGDPITHSMSPHMHSAAFRELGMNDCSYIAYRIPRGELAQGVEALCKIGISGFNVTVPHKVEMMRHLDRVDESCSLAGATNTVARSADDGTLKGYNTDIDGFADPIHKRSIDLRGARVLLLGAGGAARAAVVALAREQVGRLQIANRTAEPASGLANLAEAVGIARIDVVGLDEADEYAGRSEMIVNATSMGLAGGGAEAVPISAESINKETVVYDVVYVPMKTDLIRKARSKKAVCILGYEMLLGQAARAFEVWHAGRKAPYDAMRRALLGGV